MPVHAVLPATLAVSRHALRVTVTSLAPALQCVRRPTPVISFPFSLISASSPSDSVCVCVCAVSYTHLTLPTRRTV